jgi:arsenate reductase-like glutaredoxin family protein
VLDKKKVKVREERQSRKEPLTETDAKALLASVGKVILARGKAIRRVAAKDATIDDLRGVAGAFRAPMVRRGKTLLVGFNEEELEKLIG